jgi:CRP/FNR family transcriptional regulator, cyclic AMP receptor protein
MHPDTERLKQVPLFAGLSDEELSELASWLDDDEFGSGPPIVHEKGIDYEFFIVDEGKVRVEQDGQTLATLGPGEVFGEMAFFADGRRMADVVAETDARVLGMFGTHFREMQAAMPEVASRLEKLAQERAQMNSER